MDPNSGRIMNDTDLEALRRVDADAAAKFSVRLEGAQKDIERIAAAVQRDAKQREKNRAKNKAARAARRAAR